MATTQQSPAQLKTLAAPIIYLHLRTIAPARAAQKGVGNVVRSYSVCNKITRKQVPHQPNHLEGLSV